MSRTVQLTETYERKKGETQAQLEKMGLMLNARYFESNFSIDCMTRKAFMKENPHSYGWEYDRYVERYNSEALEALDTAAGFFTAAHQMLLKSNQTQTLEANKTSFIEGFNASEQTYLLSHLSQSDSRTRTDMQDGRLGIACCQEMQFGLTLGHESTLVAKDEAYLDGLILGYTLHLMAHTKTSTPSKDLTQKLTETVCHSASYFEQLLIRADLKSQALKQRVRILKSLIHDHPAKFQHWQQKTFSKKFYHRPWLVFLLLTSLPMITGKIILIAHIKMPALVTVIGKAMLALISTSALSASITGIIPIALTMGVLGTLLSYHKGKTAKKNHIQQQKQIAQQKIQDVEMIRLNPDIRTLDDFNLPKQPQTQAASLAPNTKQPPARKTSTNMLDRIQYSEEITHDDKGQNTGESKHIDPTNSVS